MWKLLANTVADFIEDDCTNIAASLAYYTMFSLAPLLVILLTVSGLVLEPQDVRGQISHEISRVVGQQGAQQVQAMVESVHRPGHGILATVIGLAALLFGATGVMVQLQAALNKVWEVTPDPDAGGIRNFVVKRIVSLAMLLGFAFVLLVSLVVSWVLKAAGDRLESFLPGEAPPWVWMLGHELVLVIVAAVLFAAMFKFLPDATIRWRDVTVGALFTAVMFVAGKFAIGLYLGASNVADAYGAAGSLVLVLVWVYYSSMIFLLGAEFTQAWTRRQGRRIQPEEGAARVIEREEKVPS